MEKHPSEITYLDGRRYYDCLMAGYEYIIPLEEAINKLNVFPIPDYDTGSNMVATFKAIVHRTGERITRNLGEMAKSIADVAQEEARGNIGFLFYHFFLGFAEEVHKKHKIHVREFAQAFQKAAEKAKTAIENPEEGTVLTLFRGWADNIQESSNSISDFTDCLRQSLRQSRSLLKETTSQLSVLAAHNVVDAGAQGFVHILEGIDTFIHTGDIRRKKFYTENQDFGEDYKITVRKSKDIPTVVVTDSTCDLPEEVFNQFNINVVPVRLRFGDDDFVDKITISNEEFWVKLRGSTIHPQTSQPPPGDFSKMYSALFSEDVQNILSVHLPAALSGTLQSAATAKNILKKNISVLDSENGSIGLGLIVMRVAEAISKGFSFEQSLTVAEQAAQKTNIYIGLASLDNAVRGGRVSPTVKKIADFLHITPILTFKKEGIKPAGVITGRKNMTKKLLKFVKKKIPAGTAFRIGIVHGNCEHKIADIQKSFETMPECDQVVTTFIGPALGVHAGEGSVAIAVQLLQDDLAKN